MRATGALLAGKAPCPDQLAQMNSSGRRMRKRLRADRPRDAWPGIAIPVDRPPALHRSLPLDDRVCRTSALVGVGPYRSATSQDHLVHDVKMLHLHRRMDELRIALVKLDGREVRDQRYRRILIGRGLRRPASMASRTCLWVRRPSTGHPAAGSSWWWRREPAGEPCSAREPDLRHRVGPVLLQEPHRLLQGIAAERVAQLLRHHDLEHGGAAAGDGVLQRIADLVRRVDLDAPGPHGLGDGGEAGFWRLVPR